MSIEVVLSLLSLLLKHQQDDHYYLHLLVHQHIVLKDYVWPRRSLEISVLIDQWQIVSFTPKRSGVRNPLGTQYCWDAMLMRDSKFLSWKVILWVLYFTSRWWPCPFHFHIICRGSYQVVTMGRVWKQSCLDYKKYVSMTVLYFLLMINYYCIITS